MKVDTCHIELESTDKQFITDLYADWDHFFHTAVETVMEEELCAMDKSDDIINVEYLFLDLGIVPQEHFEEKFADFLRVKLRDMLLKFNQKKQKVDEVGLVYRLEQKSQSRSAFDALSFFLMHGYVPDGIDERFRNIHFLLSQTLSSEYALLRDFLEAYGHYSFIAERLVLQFDDDELDHLLEKVRPSESKYISLYIHLHLSKIYKNTESIEDSSFIYKEDYRTILWKLVFAYLYCEGKGYFSRKQFVLYTLTGLATHYNTSVSQLLKRLSQAAASFFKNNELELVNLIEDLQNEQLDNTSSEELYQLYNKLGFSFPVNDDSSYDLNFFKIQLEANFADEFYLDRTLPLLDNRTIASIVDILFPMEREFIFTYSTSLDSGKDRGVLTGKCGSGFHCIKWKFIFLVGLSLPSIASARILFVQNVLYRLANHYNVTFFDLVRLFLPFVEVQPKTVFQSILLSILNDINEGLNHKETPNTEQKKQVTENELLNVLRAPASLGVFLKENCTQMEEVIAGIRPSESNFIISYARQLSIHKDGLLEGKAGSDFEILKWSFLLTCLLIPQGATFQKKNYVQRVLLMLGAHYNVDVLYLLRVFVSLLPNHGANQETNNLRLVLKELYIDQVKEHTIKLSLQESEMEYWLKMVFDEVPDNSSKLKWLSIAIEHYSSLFVRLWKNGEISHRSILQLLRNNPVKQIEFLKVIQDTRINKIILDIEDLLKDLSKAGVGSLQIEKIRFGLFNNLLVLSNAQYIALSYNELCALLKRNTNVAFIKADLLSNLKQKYSKQKTVTEEPDDISSLKRTIMKINDFTVEMDQVNDTGKKKQCWTVENAGLVLFAPYLPRLFQYAGYLDDEQKTFVDDDFKIRAVFLMQYIVYGEEREYNEDKLFLNRLMVALDEDVPIPKECPLSEDELNLASSMLSAVKSQWSKVSNTSVDAFRISFLQRSGLLREEDGAWQLKIYSRTYDLLIDTVPWSFKMIKFRWMEQMIMVEWESKL